MNLRKLYDFILYKMTKDWIGKWHTISLKNLQEIDINPFFSYW